jgi:hypothetical protein
MMCIWGERSRSVNGVQLFVSNFIVAMYTVFLEGSSPLRSFFSPAGGRLRKMDNANAGILRRGNLFNRAGPIDATRVHLRNL